MSANERLEYELSLAVERDLLSAIDASFEDGEMKGIKKGREEGREEGIKEGVLRNARRMKEKGFSTEDIMEITGLTFEEVSQL